MILESLCFISTIRNAKPFVWVGLSLSAKYMAATREGLSSLYMGPWGGVNKHRCLVLAFVWLEDRKQVGRVRKNLSYE
jgi:hypothetical protein